MENQASQSHDSGQSKDEDVAATLARHITALQYHDLAKETVAATKLSILDTLAATIAGSSQPGIEAIVHTLCEWGGKGESSIALHDHRLPAHEALIANVAMAHALEIDDAHYPAIVHPTAPTLWAALAMAQAYGPVSGKDLIAAVAGGVDLMVRIGLAAPRTLYLGYHTALISGFGAAAVAGKLRRLTAAQMLDAFGITFSQAGATVQAAKDGALSKRLQPAFNASDGVRAVDLAVLGVTGIHRVFEGRFGFYRLFNHSACDRGIILHRLGRHYYGTELTIKRYPTSRCLHAPIEGTVALVKDDNIRPEQVEAISVTISEGCLNVAGAPFDCATRESQTAAQFCIAYGVAAAVLWRDVFVDQIQRSALNDPLLEGLAGKVHIMVDPALRGTMSFTPVTVCITTKDGIRHCRTVTRLRGSPGNQLTWDEVVQERLVRAARHSVRPLDDAKLARIERTVAMLDDEDDASAILDLLNGKAHGCVAARSSPVRPTVAVREAIRAAGGDQQQDAIGLLVDHVRATTYDKLPDEAIEATKKSVLDSIATTIAGYHAERCQEVRQYLSDIGGRADSRIVFQDGRVPAHHAVLANIMMCHALELDDLYDDAVAHASTPAVWSAFAIVDKQGGCSGKEFLTAVMLGADVKCRIAAAASRTFSNGHHNSLLAGFAAVAAAGKLANADAEVMWNAFGLALSQAAASVQALPDGALVKRLQPALNAADGLRSLDLAGNGVTGVRNVLEGQFGFCNLFHHASCAREILTDQLGIRFLGADSSIKRYPSSRCTHGPIQAVLQLIKDRPIAITEIDTIEVKVSATCVEVAGAPWASAKGSPQVNAQFNIPYCVAAALVWQDFFVPQIDDLIDDPRVKALATRVKVGVVPEGRDRMTFAPVELTIRMRQGETIEYRVEALKGSPQDPMSWNEIIDERVKRCVAYSGNIVPAANVATLIDLVRNLEHVQDVREILDLLAQAAPRH